MWRREHSSLSLPRKHSSSLFVVVLCCVVVKAVGASASQAAHWWTTLSTRYSEPQRAYHTLTHIAHMLGLVEQYQSRLCHHTNVALATWFHDVIYEPKRNDNEEASRDLWCEFAREIKMVE